MRGRNLTACALRCRLSPVFVERVSIRDALGGTDGLQRGGFKSLLDPVELVEPTFQVGSDISVHAAKQRSMSAEKVGTAQRCQLNQLGRS